MLKQPDQAWTKILKLKNFKAITIMLHFLPKPPPLHIKQMQIFLIMCQLQANIATKLIATINCLVIKVN